MSDKNVRLRVYRVRGFDSSSPHVHIPYRFFLGGDLFGTIMVPLGRVEEWEEAMGEYLDKEGANGIPQI